MIGVITSAIMRALNARGDSRSTRLGFVLLALALLIAYMTVPQLLSFRAATLFFAEELLVIILCVIVNLAEAVFK